MVSVFAENTPPFGIANGRARFGSRKNSAVNKFNGSHANLDNTRLTVRSTDYTGRGVAFSE